MPAPAIPAGIKPLVSGYSVSGPGGVMRTEVAGGSARQALAWDRGPSTYSVTFLLDAGTYSVWEVFYLWIIRKGAISFTMPLDSGFGISSHLCTMLPGSYRATAVPGRFWSVAFDVEAESQAYSMTAADAQALVDYHNAAQPQGSLLLGRIAQFALVDTNALNF